MELLVAIVLETLLFISGVLYAKFGYWSNLLYLPTCLVIGAIAGYVKEWRKQ